MNYQISNESQAIRENFRKQIRRRQIQQYFAVKRKLVVDEISHHDNNSNKYNLADLSQQIKSMHDIGRKLSVLGNFLYSDNCLSKTQQSLGRQTMQKLCLKITNTIFSYILPKLDNKMDEEQQQNRIKALTVVSNIVADKLAPHQDLVPIISQGIINKYGSVTLADKYQAVEIGWIIANIVGCRLDLSVQGQLEKPIQQILNMAQQAILVQNLQMVSMLYRNLEIFFNYVNEYFGSNQSTSTSLIEHYKIHRLILLQSTVSYNLDLQMGTTLLNILPFISSNLQYISSCNEKLSIQICNKLFKILNGTSSVNIMKAIFQIVKKLATDRDVIVTIVKDHYPVLEKCLLYQGTSIKIEVVRLIGYLCIDQEITAFMAEIKSMENIVCDLIRVLKDSDTLCQLIVLTKIILQQTNRRHGKNALLTIQQCLLDKCKSHQVMIQARQILENYS